MSVIFHIPHSSRYIPSFIRNTLAVSDKELSDELLCMTDAYTDELFGGMWNNIVFPYSRLVVDVERYPDGRELMEERGMGAIYSRTSTGAIFRDGLVVAERADLLRVFYEPHHRELRDRTQRFLDQYNRCLIIDCHSFSSKPLLHEPDQSPVRPDICIGTTGWEPPYGHTPRELSRDFCQAFKEEGFTVGVDRPFSGSILSEKFLDDLRVSTIMVEVNRALYVTETTGEKAPMFDEFRGRLQRVLRNLTVGMPA